MTTSPPTMRPPDGRRSRWAQEARTRSADTCGDPFRRSRSRSDRRGSGAVDRAVLSRTQLSTRAFYRHFESKDQLVAAVFLEMARAEVLRLEQRMSKSEPVRAVAAWIDGRLDLAFNQQVRSDLRQMSLEAQNQMVAAPELVAPAYREILRPLVEQLTRGKDLGYSARSIPTAKRCPSMVSCGPTSNGIGRRLSAIPAKSAGAYSVSACGVSGSPRSDRGRTH